MRHVISSCSLGCVARHGVKMEFARDDLASLKLRLRTKVTTKRLLITHRLPFTRSPIVPESGATQALVGLSVSESALE